MSCEPIDWFWDEAHEHMDKTLRPYMERGNRAASSEPVLYLAMSDLRYVTILLFHLFLKAFPWRCFSALSKWSVSFGLHTAFLSY